MFRYTSLREQILLERQKNALLKEQADQNTANIDYIAMMSDIELGMGETEDDEIEQ